MKLHIAKKARGHLFLFHQHDESALEHLYSPLFRRFGLGESLNPFFFR